MAGAALFSLIIAQAAPAATPADLGWNDLSGVPAVPSDAILAFEKIHPGDARSTRGFYWGALDGTVHTRRYSGHVWEWPRRSNGVGYLGQADRALHVTLDGGGFNHMTLRGGFGGQLRDGVTTHMPPWDGSVIQQIASVDDHFRWLPSSLQPLDRLSFVNVPELEGRIADLQLFRIGEDALAEPFSSKITLYFSSDAAPPLDPLLADRFDASDQTVVALGSIATSGGVQLAPLEFVHLATPPFQSGDNVGALQLNLSLPEADTGAPVRVILHDPLNPRLELINIDVTLDGAGALRLLLDFPDQVISQDDTRLWISVACRDATILKPWNSGVPIEFRYRADADALAEYLPYRRNLLRHQFQVLSEPRPWSDYATPETLENSNYTDLLIELRDTLVALHALAPDDPVSREYWEWVNPLRLDDSELLHPVDASVPDLPGMPLWAELQLDIFHRLRDAVFWWYENRLIENGELGGAVNDDTDFTGHVVNLAMRDTDTSLPIIRDAVQRLSDTLSGEYLDHGLPIVRRDTLHFYEDGLNLQGYMPYLDYGDPVALERVMLSAHSLIAISGVNGAGHRHFRTDTFAAEDLDVTPPATFERGHTLLFAHSPMMIHWYNGAPTARGFIHDYLGAWLEHFAPDHYPQRIEFDTDIDLALASRATRGGASIGHSYMMMHWRTGDTDWLYPFELGFDSGDRAFDWQASFCDLFMRADMSPWSDDLLPYYRSYSDRDYAAFLAWLLSGDKADLEDSLRATLRQLRRYPWMYTGAEPYTDRVEFPHEYVSRIAMGGGSSRNEWYSTRALSFEGFHLNVGSLVYDNQADALRFALANSLDAPIEGRVRLWQLDHGVYRVRTGPDLDDDGTLDSTTADETIELARHDALDITLPAREIRLFVIEQVTALSPLTDRPDLAASMKETTFDGASAALQTIVHNIGGAPSGPFDVAILDARGCELTRLSFPSLDPPADLEPRTTLIDIAPIPAGGVGLLIDPDAAIHEITETNNAVTFRAPESCDPLEGADCDANGIVDLCESAPTGDADNDCDADLHDFAVFQRCARGAAQPYPTPCCSVFDFDTDGHVDLHDFAAFVAVTQG